MHLYLYSYHSLLINIYLILIKYRNILPGWESSISCLLCYYFNICNIYVYYKFSNTVLNYCFVVLHFLKKGKRRKNYCRVFYVNVHIDRFLLSAFVLWIWISYGVISFQLKEFPVNQVCYQSNLLVFVFYPLHFERVVLLDLEFLVDGHSLSPLARRKRGVNYFLVLHYHFSD